MNNEIRVRFAPSPTGPLHIGGVRTALYNYLFAKHNNGTFIIRIEDTDQTRFVDGAEKYILDALAWCGMTPDEATEIGGAYGPYTQSKRREIYKTHIDQLITKGHAYYAFDTAQEIEAKREEQKTLGNLNWQYDASTRGSMRNSLTLNNITTLELLDSGYPYTIRANIIPGETIYFEDIIRGGVSVQSDILDDKVLYKSDGLPTYHFANIVDDHLMKISHVIRGEEWLPSTALHTLLYSYFGWEKPKFAHLPLILKPDGKGKLSKRDGDQMGFPVFPLNWTTTNGDVFAGFREQGYLPEAFINMLALLGWNPGTEQEIIGLDELIQLFSLEKVNKSGARFDPDKTKWFQQQYVKNSSNLALLEQIVHRLPKNEYDQAQLEKIVELLKERIVFPQDILTQGIYFFEEPKFYDEKTVSKKWNNTSSDILQKFSLKLKDLNNFKAAQIEATFHGFLENEELGLGQVMPILRLALTGVGSGPQIFEIAEILGNKTVYERIQQAINSINA